MAMTEATPRGHYGELVRLHTQGRRFLDREDERRLLEEGVTRYGLPLEEARGVVRAAAAEENIALERELGASTGQLLRALADRGGKVSRRDFDKAVAFYRARAGQSVTRPEAERRVKRLLEEAALSPARNGWPLPTRRWYRAIEA